MSFSVMLRLAAIAIGIASVTILASKGFGFQFHPFFLAVLEKIEEDYEFWFGLISPYIRWALAHLAESFGWDLPLYPHWKHTFVLLWLFFGSWARAVASPKYWWAFRSFAWTWGGVVALVAAVSSGTVPLSDAAVLWWPMAGFALYLTGGNAWSATFYRSDDETWLSAFGLGGLVKLAATGVAVLFAARITPSPDLHFETSPRPGLATLAAVTVAVAALLLLYGGLNLALARALGIDHATDTPGKGNDEDEVVTSVLPGVRVRGLRRAVVAAARLYMSAGLDMLAVIGGATAIVAINQMLV